MYRLGVSTFLALRPFSTVPHVVLTPTVALFSLLRYSCNSSPLMHCHGNIFEDSGLRTVVVDSNELDLPGALGCADVQ